jgi:hypothetical protein
MIWGGGADTPRDKGLSMIVEAFFQSTLFWLLHCVLHASTTKNEDHYQIMIVMKIYSSQVLIAPSTAILISLSVAVRERTLIMELTARC